MHFAVLPDPEAQPQDLSGPVLAVLRADPKEWSFGELEAKLADRFAALDVRKTVYQLGSFGQVRFTPARRFHAV